MQSSPNAIPMPALAPSRQRSPIEMTGAAAGQGAHDRSSTTHVGVAPNHHTRRDPALNHRGAKRAGIEVDEALMHHRRLGEMGAQPHSIGVTDPYPVGTT